MGYTNGWKKLVCREVSERGRNSGCEFRSSEGCVLLSVRMWHLIVCSLSSGVLLAQIRKNLTLATNASMPHHFKMLMYSAVSLRSSLSDLSFPFLTYLHFAHCPADKALLINKT